MEIIKANKPSATHMKSAGLSRPIKGSERYRDRKRKRKARENSGSERDLLKHLGKEKEKTVQARKKCSLRQKEHQRSKSQPPALSPCFSSLVTCY